ncbi:LysR family transcriptional regulator [Ancylobacter pratisalsi]|uniref:LysR family transcriptional regulator n=1 Tax=Ancylobacter pratisalsi TaxID=1745854 RepID=A0A6P1YPM6_9HYPH|nr:LysR family transcriptional regulator [Ancylobacter pratisalsi]QIB34656.1 LysR family transcriptional regulator [Ancylobacter pratisalsi]
MDRLEAMALLVRAVEAGSLSAAARETSKSVTAVSRSIAAMETELGVQLLRRTTRSLALTEQGRLFYARSKAILGDLRELDLAVASTRSEPVGRLRVSAPTLIGRRILAPLVADFLARYPSMSIDLVLLDRAVNLIEEEIDLSVRIGHLPDSELLVRKLDEIDLIVCASPDYLARRDAPSRPEDLKAHDCLTFSESPGPVNWRFHVDGRSRIVRLNGRLSVNDLDVAVASAREGLGITRAPSWYVADDLRAGRLQALLGAFQREPTPVQLLFQHARMASPKLSRFVDHVAMHWPRIGKE